MITFSKFGKYGNLGNQLFQYASMIGFAEKYGVQMKLPKWDYADYFHPTWNFGSVTPNTKLDEPHFHFTPDFWDSKAGQMRNTNCDITGWIQSEKYWLHCKEKVDDALGFRTMFVDSVKQKFHKELSRPTIGISIRRGDYVNNPCYDLLPINYYILALYEHFPNWKDCNILFFSDDIGYCKHHFECLPNAYFIQSNAIEQLCTMTLCDHLIIANSTFSWWGAYLNKKGGKVVRPCYMFAGPLKNNSIADHYPESWIAFDHKEADGTCKKIDLRDATFVMPVSFDHLDRKQNIDLTVCLIQRHFETNIIVGEHGRKPMFGYMKQWAKYHHFDTMFEFHRTKMLNDMFAMAETPIVFNWDVDVIACPMQILRAVELMREGVSMVYPYDGRFARVNRFAWRPKLEQQLDTGVFGITQFQGMNGAGNDRSWLSVGGAVGFRKDDFFEGGGENEEFVSYGPEDMERIYRFEKLGYKVERVKGTIYHIDHHISLNSSNRHPHFQHNADLWARIKAMTAEEVKAYSQGFSWRTSQPNQQEQN